MAIATPAAEGMAARGKVRLEAADVEPWLMTVGAALPGMGLGTPVALAAEADYAKGLLVLNKHRRDGRGDGRIRRPQCELDAGAAETDRRAGAG